MPIDPVTGYMIASGASAGLGAITSALGAFSTNDANIRENRKNREWQEMMSNTSHRREMNDLKKAGLNPLLTGKYGGASTPSGGVPQLSNPLEPLGKAGSEIGSMLANRPLLKAQVENTNSQTAVNSAQASKLQTEKLLVEQELEQKGKMNPLSLESLTKQIELTGQTSALKAKEILRANEEIRKLKLELEKLEVQRRLWTVGNDLIPSAKKIVDKIKQIKNDFQNSMGDKAPYDKKIKILRN